MAFPTYQIFISCWELGIDTKGPLSARFGFSSNATAPDRMHLLPANGQRWLSATQMAETTMTALPLPSSGGSQAERHPRHIKYCLLGIKPSRQTSQNIPGAKPSECS